MDWETDWTKPRYSDAHLHEMWRANLHEMCREGIRAVAAGRYSGLHFKLFNRREADVVRAFMAEHSPGTPFGVNFFDFDRPPRP